MPKSPLKTVVERAVAAVDFIQRKQKSGTEFTAYELSKALELQKPWGSYRYLDALSMHYPIYEVSPYKKGSGFARGAVPAKFKVLK